jgi:hypothetical protein
MAQDQIAVPPLPAGNGGESPGSSELAAELMSSFASPLAPTTPAKEVAAPPAKETPAAPAKAPDKAPAAPAKETSAPAAKTTPPPAPAKDVDPDDPKLTAQDLRKELKRLKETAGGTVREREKRISELQDQMASFEKRRYWTDDDLKLHEAATKRLATLESELYSRDYTASPEYKSKYQDRFDEVWREASEEIKGMTVRYQDGVDEANQPKYAERPATNKDLLAVTDAPASERMRIAKQLFGDDREAVLQWAREIALIRKDAAKAVEDKRNGYASEITTRNQKFQEANQKVSQFIQQQGAHLEKLYPHIFSASADKPEAQEALKKGFAFVDESSAKMMEYDINTRAARAAVIRSMAGAFPRLAMDNSRLAARVTELEEQLGKFEKSDPSNLGGAGGGGGDDSKKDGGSDDLAREIDKLNKR